MDPFQKKYGDIMSSVLIFPTLVADVLWVARTLVSLGELLHPPTLPGTRMCTRAPANGWPAVCGHGGAPVRLAFNFSKSVQMNTDSVVEGG